MLETHAADSRLPRGEPVIDRGEFRFRFLLGIADRAGSAAVDFLEEPPLVATLPACL